MSPDCDWCGGPCEGCGQDCSCDSHADHDAATERSRLEFLCSPGAAPAYFTDEQVERASRAITEARKEAGL